MNTGRIIETIVFNQLKVDSFSIMTGKINNIEINFIATYKDIIYYIQVSESIEDYDTRAREILPFELLDGDVQKILITNDKKLVKLSNDIKHMLLEDFLINGLG